MSSIAGEWNNWPRYREIIIARFTSQGQLHLINPVSSTFGGYPRIPSGYTYRNGLWYKPGIKSPSIPSSEFAFLASRSAGILILIDCLPTCLYDQALHRGEVWQKWEFWNTTYEQRQELARADALGSPISDEPHAPAPTPTPTPADTTPRPQPPTVLSKEANDFLLDKLKKYPKYGQNHGSPLPSIREHLTFMLVIYEGLVSRNARITEQELIHIIHNTLSTVPTLQAFVVALDAQAKKQGLTNVSVYDLVESVAAYETSVGKDKVVLMLQNTE